MRSEMKPETRMQQMKASEVSNIREELDAIRRNRRAAAVASLPVFGFLFAAAKAVEEAVIFANQSNQLANKATNIIYANMQNGNTSVISAVHTVTGSTDMINTAAAPASTNAHLLANYAVENAMQFWQDFGLPKPGYNSYSNGMFPPFNQTVCIPHVHSYSVLFNAAGSYIVNAQNALNASFDLLIAAVVLGFITTGYVHLYRKFYRKVKSENSQAFSAERARDIRRTLRAIKRGEIEVVE